MSEHLICRDLTAGVAFFYNGGPYIEVYWSDAMAIRGPAIPVNPDPATPFTVIPAPAEPVYEAAFRLTCQRWLTENRADLGGYLESSI